MKTKLDLIIGLGTNLPLANGTSGPELLELAIQSLLRQLAPNLSLVQQSKYYRSAPEGMIESSAPHLTFTNMVAHVQLHLPLNTAGADNTFITSDFNILELYVLKQLLNVELQFGRDRSMLPDSPLKNSRTLDLDLLFCQNMALCSSRLQFPHPHWSDRSFVVRPLLELDYWKQFLSKFYAELVEEKIKNGFRNEAQPLIS